MKPERIKDPQQYARKVQLAKQVIELVADGMAITKAAPMVKGIHRDTFFEMIREDETLSALYAKACDQRALIIFESMIETAEDRSNDVLIDERGRMIGNNAAVQRDRLIIDTKKWILAKLAPKVYGDKLQIDSPPRCQL